MRGKIIDDIAGVVGSLVGLANDVRLQVKNSTEKMTRDCALRSGLSTQDEVDALNKRISDLEQRLADADKQGKGKK